MKSWELEVKRFFQLLILNSLCFVAEHRLNSPASIRQSFLES